MCFIYNLNDISNFQTFRYKPPKEDNSNKFYKMQGRPKSYVRILVPEGKEPEGSSGGRHIDSPQSVVSRAFSAVSHSTLSNLRYQLFGARTLKTPDYFRKDGVAGLLGKSNEFLLVILF